MHGDEVSRWPAKRTQTATIFDARFERHFPSRSNDFAVVVLKGHLLLEESASQWLEALLHRPEAIKGANLGFHQKLCLIRALDPVGPGFTFRMIEAAEKLNMLRNKLAHHLDHPQIEVLVRNFLLLCEEPADRQEPNEPETKAVPLIRRLKIAIVYLCAVFEEMSVSVPEREL